MSELSIRPAEDDKTVGLVLPEVPNRDPVPDRRGVPGGLGEERGRISAKSHRNQVNDSRRQNSISDWRVARCWSRDSPWISQRGGRYCPYLFPQSPGCRG